MHKNTHSIRIMWGVNGAKGDLKFHYTLTERDAIRTKTMKKKKKKKKWERKRVAMAVGR